VKGGSIEGKQGKTRGGSKVVGGDDLHLAVQHSKLGPQFPSCPQSTTSFTVTQTMQAVHQLPPMLGHHYPRHSLNGINLNPGPSVMTPPVATRKRKRAHQYTVNYSEVQEVDSDGRLREVIVIDDTPPPPTMSPATTHTGAFSASYQPPVYSAPIRTRARAAAEAHALSASSSSAVTAPAPKRRKREHPEEVRAPAVKKLAPSGQQSQQVAQTKSWDSRSAAATDDVCIQKLAL
jgi:dual-specificity kinase